jgi:hypothetical protein
MTFIVRIGYSWHYTPVTKTPSEKPFWLDKVKTVFQKTIDIGKLRNNSRKMIKMKDLIKIFE